MTTPCIADLDGNGILLTAPGSSGEPHASRPPCVADCWSWEIHAINPDRSLPFSTELFGWPSGTLSEWGWTAIDTGSAGGPTGAISRDETPRVMISIAVADLEATLFRATELGARTIVEPWDVAETHRLAIIEDHEGNRIGLHSASEAA